MPLSLLLPYPLCRTATRVMRRWSPRQGAAGPEDQTTYFMRQYESTGALWERFLHGVSVRDKVVLDVGGGLGGRTPYWIEQGAARVVCIDINRQELVAGAEILRERFPRLASSVQFLHPQDVAEKEFADVAVLVDCFEHLVEPVSVLRQIHRWLKPGGIVWIGSIAWYHYAASHCLGHLPIPWCQLLFSEKAIIRTIQSLLRDPEYVPNLWEKMEGISRWDRVTTLRDRPGEPLNMLSLRGVQKTLRQSPFTILDFRVHGFSGRARRAGRYLSSLARIPVLNEVFHSYYTAVLARPAASLPFE